MRVTPLLACLLAAAVCTSGATAASPTDAGAATRLPRLDPTVARWELPLSIEGHRWRLTLDRDELGADHRHDTVTLRGVARTAGHEPVVVLGTIPTGDAPDSPTLLLLLPDRLLLVTAADDSVAWHATAPTKPRDSVVAHRALVVEAVKETAAPALGVVSSDASLRVRIDDASGVDRDSVLTSWPRAWSDLAISLAGHLVAEFSTIRLTAVGDPERDPHRPRPHLTLRLAPAQPGADPPEGGRPEPRWAGEICDPHGRQGILRIARSVAPNEVDDGLTSILALTSAILEGLGAPGCAESPQAIVGADPSPRLRREAAEAVRATLAAVDCFGPPPIGVPGPVTVERLDCATIVVRWTRADGARRHEILIGDETDAASGVGPMRSLGHFEGDADPLAVSIQLAEIDRDAVRAIAVRGVDGERRGPPTPAVTIDPAPRPRAPDLQASDGLCGAVVLSWEAVPGATRYAIFRAPGPDPHAAQTRIAETDGTAHRDAEVSPGSTHWYRAIAVDGCGRHGSPSDAVPGAVAAAVTAVAGLTAATTCDAVRLTWPPVMTASHHAVYRAVGDAPAEPIAATEGSEWTDDAPPTGVPIRYLVRAVGACGLGPPSPMAVVTVDGKAPRVEPPTPVAVACGTEFVLPPPAVANRDCAGDVDWIAPAPTEALVLSRRLDDGSLRLALRSPGIHELALRAVAAHGAVDLTLRVEVLSSTPVIVEQPTRDAACGSEWRLAWPALANPRCAGAVTWSLLEAPEGVVRDVADDGASVGVRWPTPSPGRHLVRIGADGAGGSAETIVELQVAPAPPELPELAEIVVAATAPWRLRLPEPPNVACAGPIVWAIDDELAGVTIDPDSDAGSSGWTLAWDSPTPGRHRLALTATGPGGSAPLIVALRVAPPAPVAAPWQPDEAECGSAWRAALPAVTNLDDAGPVAWRIALAPDGAALAEHGELVWPNPTLGSHDIELVADGPGGVTPVRATLVVRATVPAVAFPERIVVDAETPVLRRRFDRGFGLIDDGCVGPVEWAIVDGPDGVLVAVDPDGQQHLEWSLPTLGSHAIVLEAVNDAGSAGATLVVEVMPVPPRLAAFADADAECGVEWTAPLPRLLDERRVGRVVWSIESGPPGLAVDLGVDDGMVRWARTEAGEHRVVVRAEGPGGVATVAAMVRVAALPPALVTPPPQSIPCGGEYPATTVALESPQCAGGLEWLVIEGPTGLTVDATGTLRWPDPVPGHYPTVVEARSALGASRASWTITVDATAPPTIARIADAIHRLAVDDDAVDLEYRSPPLRLTAPECMEPVTWRLVAAPEGMTIGGGPLPQIVWPSPVVGEHEIEVEASNPHGAHSVVWRLTVERVGAEGRSLADRKKETHRDSGNPLNPLNPRPPRVPRPPRA